MASIPHWKFDQDILNAMQHPGKAQKFLSIQEINDFTVKSRISKALETLSRHPDDISRLIKHIHSADRPAKKIFLILVRSGKLDKIDEFLSSGFSDHDLPITVPRSKNGSVVKNAGGSSWPAKVFGEGKINVYDVEPFKYNQWPFLSPVFTDGKFKFEVHPEIPLPLIEKSTVSRSSGPGGLSTAVYKVKIDPLHLPGRPSVSHPTKVTVPSKS